MTATAPPIDAGIARAQAWRLRAFHALLAVAGLAGALFTVHDGDPDYIQYIALPFYVAYVTWILSDMHVRRVTGWKSALLLLVSLFPFWGLLAYLTLTRRLVGVVQWLAFCFALAIPFTLLALVTRLLLAASST